MTVHMKTAQLIILFSIFCSGTNAALSRNQWDMPQQSLPPGQSGAYVPGQMPGQLHQGVPPQLSKDFWAGQHPSLINNIPAGTMLTGVLENEISSAKSKAGHSFAIKLEDGYAQNGMQLIPVKSKIIGSITSVTPAKNQRYGQPGSIQVSMQSLLMPDGTHIPFHGMIAYNPNHAYKDAPRQSNSGFDIRDTGAHLGSMFSSFTNGIGFMYNKRYRGNDFYLDKGELLPVRITGSMSIPEQFVKPVGSAAQAPPAAHHHAGAPPQAVPGLIGADVAGQPPSSRQTVPGLVEASDPFNTPLKQPQGGGPLGKMPDPF